MFVPAESFSANIYEGLFTHYKRKEDATMKSGKLDEELSRMSDIVDNITSKIIEGKPLQTSFGEDLYNRIFETDN